MNIVTVERIRVRFQRQRDNTLLHKDKDLNTSFFVFVFYIKSVPDDKHRDISLCVSDILLARDSGSDSV